MQRSIFWMSCAIVLGLMFAFPSLSALGKDKADAKQADAKAKPVDKAAEAKPKTDKKSDAPKKDAPKKDASKRDAQKLPPYYGDVINEDQREKIASAYTKFNTKLAKLKDEIKTLTAERDKALEDLLTADQKGKLAKLKEDAKAKRGKTAAK